MVIEEEIEVIEVDGLSLEYENTNFTFRLISFYKLIIIFRKRQNRFRICRK